MSKNFALHCTTNIFSPNIHSADWAPSVLSRYVLLGEACYPLQSWLMKAFPEEKRGKTVTEPQRVFSRRLRRALHVAEEALLRLRARWQCLSKRNDCGLDVVPTMILACCILHNVCESHGDVFKAEWQEEVAEAESPQPSHKQFLSPSTDQTQAEEVRRLYCDYFEQPDWGIFSQTRTEVTEILVKFFVRLLYYIHLFIITLHCCFMTFVHFYEVRHCVLHKHCKFDLIDKFVVCGYLTLIHTFLPASSTYNLFPNLRP